MHKKKKAGLSLLIAVIMISILPLPASADTWDLTLPSLTDVFADYFVIGNIMEPRRLNRSETTSAFAHHYSFVTAENAMKPGHISRNANIYNFDDVDIFMLWAEEYGLGVIGHTLVWHSQSPNWLTLDEDENLLTREEARTNMQNYINEVAGRYAGRIHAWDVVNEAFLTSVREVPFDGDWRSALRKEPGHMDGNKTQWYAAYSNGADFDAGECGSDYIYDAFVFTRLADPAAILYYNDFNETDPGKREVIAMMTEELNERWADDPRNTERGRLLIEGLGLQAHYWTENLSPVSVELTILRWMETGAEISITELDIPLGRFGRYADPTEENFEHQAKLYEQLFAIFLKYSDNIERVTFWGMLDTQSWRGEGHPLIFDGRQQAKPAFFSILKALEMHELAIYGPEGRNPGADEPTEVVPPVIGEIDDDEDYAANWLLLVLLGGGILIAAVIIIFMATKKR